MAREHLNNVVLIGPISMFKVYGTDSWGNTKTGFLVGVEGGTALRVSAKMKGDWVAGAGQNAKAVAVTKAYMNGWRKTEDNSLQLNMGARASGVFFSDQILNPFCFAEVEGVVESVTSDGVWAVLKSSYSAPNSRDARHRIVIVKSLQPIPQEAVGNLMIATGMPVPKYGEDWYLHLEAQQTWILYGKK